MKKTITVKAWLAYIVVFAMFIMAGCLIGCQKESNAGDDKYIGRYIGSVGNSFVKAYVIEYDGKEFLVVIGTGNNQRTSVTQMTK